MLIFSWLGAAPTPAEGHGEVHRFSSGLNIYAALQQCTYYRHSTADVNYFCALHNQVVAENSDGLEDPVAWNSRFDAFTVRPIVPVNSPFIDKPDCQGASGSTLVADCPA